MSESLFAQIEAVREAWDVLRHPFYARWSRGELTREELARYAGQYRHAVVALADAAERAGSPHAAEGRAQLAANASAADTPRLVAAAEDALRANWRLLDGVERVSARVAVCAE